MSQWREIFPFNQCKFQVTSRGEIGGSRFDFEFLDLNKGSVSKVVYIPEEGGPKRSDLQDLQRDYELSESDVAVFERHFSSIIAANIHIWNPFIVEMGDSRVQYTGYPGHGYYFTFPDRTKNFEFFNPELRAIDPQSDPEDDERQTLLKQFYLWAEENLPTHLK